MICIQVLVLKTNEISLFVNRRNYISQTAKTYFGFNISNLIHILRYNTRNLLLSDY